MQTKCRQWPFMIICQDNVLRFSSKRHQCDPVWSHLFFLKACYLLYIWVRLPHRCFPFIGLIALEVFYQLESLKVQSSWPVLQLQACSHVRWHLAQLAHLKSNRLRQSLLSSQHHVKEILSSNSTTWLHVCPLWLWWICTPACRRIQLGGI